MARSKAYLFRGVEIRWRCDPALLTKGGTIAGRSSAAFPRRPARLPQGRARRAPDRRAAALLRRGRTADGRGGGRMGDRLAGRRARASSTPTATPCRRPRAAPTRRACAPRCPRPASAYGELTGNRKARAGHAEDVMGGAACCCRSSSASRSSRARPRRSWPAPRRRGWSRRSIKDHFDHWLPATPQRADDLLDRVVERAEERLRRKQDKRAGAQDRDPQAAPARQARRLHARQRRRHRDLPGRGRFRRRLGQAGARPRDPGRAAAARQDPQRRQRLGRQAARRTRSWPTWSRRWAAAPATHSTRRSCATSASSS